jgi:branched-chain amino acid aminotransferase
MTGESIVWVNGALRPVADPGVAADDRGLLLADGVFETLLVRGGQVVWLEDHLARMAAGAAVLGIPGAPDLATASGAIDGVLRANGLERAPRASVRMTLTRGRGPRGLLPPADPHPTLLVSAAALAETAVGSCAPSAVVARTVRRNEHSPAPRIKTLAYVDNVQARREAAAAGAEEALMLNAAGNLACATAANVFVIEGGRVATPRVADGALPGIARARLIGLLRAAEIAVAEEAISPDHLGRADALVLTNSLVGARPLGSLDGRTLPGHPIVATMTALLLEFGA